MISVRSHALRIAATGVGTAAVAAAVLAPANAVSPAVSPVAFTQPAQGGPGGGPGGGSGGDGSGPGGNVVPSPHHSSPGGSSGSAGSGAQAAPPPSLGKPRKPGLPAGPNGAVDAAKSITKNLRGPVPQQAPQQVQDLLGGPKKATPDAPAGAKDQGASKAGPDAAKGIVGSVMSGISRLFHTLFG
jgi:hypothetical protein